MRFLYQSDRYGRLLRMFTRDGETAYMSFGLSGPRAEIEFPSDWHEHKRGWIRLGFGLFKMAVSFPWSKTVPDDGQCSGPTYGFYYFSKCLVICYGKDTGTKSKKKHIYMPWSWEHVRHDYLRPDGSLHHRAEKHEYGVPAGTTETHSFVYVRRNGEVQNRVATINGEEREWRWRAFQWLPWPRMIQRTISVEFNEEVGEKSGTWKGGVVGCSYDWKRGETMKQALRRMELDRKL